MPLWEVFRPCRTCGSCLWTPMATQNHFPSPPLVSLKKAEQSSSSSLSFPVPDGLPTLSTVAGGGGAVEEWPGRRERATATWLLTFQVFKLNFKTYNENVMNQLSLSHKGGRCKFFFFFFLYNSVPLTWVIYPGEFNICMKPLHRIKESESK